MQSVESSGLYDKAKSAIASFVAGNELKARVFRGGAWLGIGSVSEQSLRFARNMVLARLLAPAAFGTMAIVMSAAALLQSFTELGVREGLIQNPRGAEPGYVNAAWWMGLLRSISIYLALFLAAPWVAKFYGNPDLTSLLRVATASLVLEGAISSRAYVAMKEMRFNRWATIQHGGGIVGVVITVILGFVLRDVWALVLGTCAESAARCLLSFVICPFLPSIRIDRAALRHLLQFSKGLFGLAPLYIIFMRADIFVLGKLVPASTLGYYSMGIAVAQVPSFFIANLLGQIFMPALSHVQTDKLRTRRIVLQVTTAIVLLGMPGVVFAYFCGRPLLTLLYGPNYAVAAGALFLASCGAVVTLVNNPINTALYASGQPQLHRRCVISMALVMMIFTYPLAKWFGPVGAQLASVISITTGFLVQFPIAKRLIDIKFGDYGKIFLHAAVVSSGVVVVCLAARMAITIAHPFLIVGIGLFGCLLAYGFVGVRLLRNPSLAQDYSN
jgi:O-antigen/teichoic acid export membrane protein